YGGHAMTEERLKLAFARNVSLLKLVGIHPVVVHGGGPQINEMLSKLEIKSEFRQGHRVTDKATMDVVEMVLVGSVNKSVVNLINKTGARAVGLSGKDGMLLEARKLAMTISHGEQQPPEIIDLGNVGEVTNVNTQLLRSLINDEFVPVIAPVGVDAEGNTYNINADSVAGAVAGALKARRLLMLTDVAGILDKEGKLIEHIDTADAHRLLEDGTLSGGMIPKINCCLDALDRGVDKVTIVDGRVENCLLLELLTDQGIGTEIVK
uniref:acetylglutamate kinase n=1 Tax=uncultured Mailhella sp. TaxID=1981031 RepID=UPI0025F6D351